MPYEHIEELGDRRNEKYLLGLTVQNLLGILALALPVLILTNGSGILVRLGAVAGAIALGIAATSTAQGLALYEWPLWWARGRIRVLVRGAIIHPHQFGSHNIRLPAQPLRVGGPLQPARWDVQAGRRLHDEERHADL